MPKVILSNNPQAITAFSLHGGVIAADIHRREKKQRRPSVRLIKTVLPCRRSATPVRVGLNGGVLGSNISSGDNIKLAPREGRQFVLSLQDLVAAELGRKIEVLIYGDGAYHDPTSGIYELADPRPVFAATDGLNRLREGIKYKYLADMYLSKGPALMQWKRYSRKEGRDNYPGYT